MAEDGLKEKLLIRRKHQPSNETSSNSDHHKPSISRVQLTLKQVAILLAAYLALGTICFYLIRDQISGTKTNGILDSMYFCVVTMTTLGYGDLVPHSNLAKVLACVFVFMGMGLGGFALSKAADYIVEKEEILFVKAMHIRETACACGPHEILNEAERYKVKYKLFSVLTLIFFLVIVGTTFLTVVEKLSLFDAFYCVCATITTLGYGDKSFSTRGGRLFAVFWIIMSTISLAQLFAYLVELWTESRQRKLVDWVLHRKLTIQDIEKADLDNDTSVSPAEYIVYKLKEMGFVSEQLIMNVLEGFKNQDVDHSGTLTANDISDSQ